MKNRYRNPLSLASKNILMNSLDPLDIPSGIRDKFGINLLTKIRVSFSDLCDHRFNHNFKRESPICLCGFEDETSVHFFLRCARYATQRTTLLSKISDIIGSDVSIFLTTTCTIFWSMDAMFTTIFLMD